MVALEKNISMEELIKNDKNWAMHSHRYLKRLAKVFEKIEMNEGNENAKIDLLSKLSKSKKHIHVRHPFSRLYSCWKDKMHYWKEKPKSSKDEKTFIKKHNIEIDNYTEKWSTKISKYETQKSLKTKNKFNSTFSWEAFLKYVISREEINKHWYPINKICQPCLIKYDFVTKLESIEVDSEKVIEKFENIATAGRLKIGKFPKANRSGKSQAGSSDVNPEVLSAFREIDKSMIRKLYDFYEDDFLMFGYDVKSFLE